MAENPFSDIYAEPPIVDTALDYFSDGNFVIVEDVGRVVELPKTTRVPLIAPLPPMSPHSPETSIASLDVASPSTASVLKALPMPIEWTEADLSYLLSCLYPDFAMGDTFVFEPAFCSHQNAQYLVNLKLFIRVPTQPVPASAYSKDAPIGTGRPVSKILVAESANSCTSAAAARKSLAQALLVNRQAVSYVAIQYQVFAAIYSRSAAELESIKRAMMSMAETSEEEWFGRMEQLRVVDSSWDLNARLESFLLESGFDELGRWYRVVEVALGLQPEDRENWTQVYMEAGAFLATAICGL